METLFQEKNRNEALSRLQALSTDSERRWGRMTVRQMLCHAADQLRMSLGEIETEPALLRRTPIKQLSICWLPWPKGKVRGPAECFSTPVALGKTFINPVRGHK